MEQKNNPVASTPVRSYTAEKRIRRFLKNGALPHITRDEYQKIHAACDNLEIRLLIEVLWTTGCRVSEALAINAQDIIRQENRYYLNALRLKRRKPIRELLPIPLDMGLKLDDYVRLKGMAADQPLFKKSTVWRTIKSVGMKVIGREITPHMFRHGRVYDLAQHGQHPFIIAKVFGHVNLETTLGYFHPGEDDIRDALSQ
ncbi:MAG: site-specific integrase [Desulfamplus sp.]|nr:site-specific integrase [Desulfamplus sp.]